VTGAEGFPALQNAGNVLRPYTAFKLSLRLPPLVDAASAVQRLESPAGRQRALPGPWSRSKATGGATGWNAPSTARWFDDAMHAASQAHFGAGVRLP
jgi:hypothetical protein